MAGQPTKYREEYCDMLKAHMADGFTFESFAGLISVNYDTLYEWCKKNDAFSEAKKIGRAMQLLDDEKTLKKLTSGKITGSAAAHIFKMKNCHKWVDRQEIEQTTTTLTLEEYLKQNTKE